MSHLTILLASAPAAPLSANPSGWGRVPGFFQDVFLVVALGIVLLAILMALVFWTRRNRRHSRHSHSHSHSHRRHRHHHSASSATTSQAPKEDAEADSVSEGASMGAEEGGESHHRRRRRRRSHRGRNPTLAETGGLPPPRPEGQIPPSL